MKYETDIKLPTFVLAILLTFFTIGIVEYLQVHFLKSQQEQIQIEAQRDLAVVRSSLEAQIYSEIYYTHSLAMLTGANPESTINEWERIARELLRRSSNLRNVAMAPNDVITFLYPLKGNEGVSGLDYRTIPEQYDSIRLARDTESSVLTGPLTLIQGGLALIVRNPIFTDPPYNTKYWGVSSAVIDVHSLLINSGVNQLEQSYHFSIRGVDGYGRTGDVFYGDQSVFDDVFASETVQLPTGTWYMAISSQGLNESWSWLQLNSVRLVGYSVFAVFVTIFFVIYSLYASARRNSLQDELTKIPNRRFFMYSLDQFIKSSTKRDVHFTLINIDLNGFKAINDTYGHAVGDIVLITVAKRIKKVIRAADLVARVGGDEYLILLPRLTDDDSVFRIVQTLRKEISGKPIKVGNSLIFPGVSIGYSIYHDTDLDADIDAILHSADIAMYRDKMNQKASSPHNVMKVVEHPYPNQLTK